MCFDYYYEIEVVHTCFCVDKICEEMNENKKVFCLGFMNKERMCYRIDESIAKDFLKIYEIGRKVLACKRVFWTNWLRI